jgi:PHD/YefM family antitoxin component YafN of YafNO toxin-antitoxin module
LAHTCSVSVPVVMSFREFRAGLAGVLDRVRQSPGAAVFVGSHRRAEAVLVSVEQYEALLEASERQRAVAAALASVRAEGLKPSAEDLTLFVDVATGQMTTDELRDRILGRYQQRLPGDCAADRADPGRRGGGLAPVRLRARSWALPG